MSDEKPARREAGPPGTTADLDAFLAQVDQKLDAEAARIEADRAEEARRLQAEHQRLHGFLAQIEPRLARARELGAAGAVTEIEKARDDLRARLAAIAAKLGYDPVERAAEEQRQAEETRRKESRDCMSRLLQRYENDGRADCGRLLAEEAWDRLPVLVLDDARRLFRTAADHAARRGSALPEDAATLLASLEAWAGAAGGAGQYAAYLDELRARRERQTEARRLVEGLHQVAIDLETAGGMRTRELELRIHAACCRAKRLQRDYSDVLTEDQDGLVYKEVFGRLRRVHGNAGCGFVPSLAQRWQPHDSLEQEIDRTEAKIRKLGEAVDAPPDAADWTDPEADRSREIERLEAKVAEAERWMLAHVVRSCYAYLDCDGAGDTGDHLRDEVRRVLEYLGKSPDVPRLLLGTDEAFKQGGEFRWLRRQLQKQRALLAAPSEEAAAGEEPVEEAAGEDATIEGVHGERLVHPLVRRARRHTKGRRIVLVGGQARPERQTELTEVFEAATLDWTEALRNEGLQRVQQLAQRVGAGNYDIVVALLGFLSHKASGIVAEAARAAGVPFAQVGRGYGAVGIANAVLDAVRRSAPRAQDSAPA